MSARRRSKPFTPGKEGAATLDARTVGRDDVLRLVAGKLANGATSRNRPHTLLIGPRGAGKTHLLEVALHRAQGAIPGFAERVAVVRLDEDLVGVPRLVDLQREILRHLGAARPGPGTYLPDAIAAALGDRVLLLVLENLDRLFASLREGGQQDFRGWVETSGQIMVLGSAPLLFPGISDRALPWWGSFAVVHLEELTLDEGRALLVHRAEEDGDGDLVAFLQSDRGLARLQAVDALTGGSPRIWMILSDVITVELLDELTPAVEALLEGLVPYYQQLLWDLSPVEQLAVRALAEGSRQAMSVGELAAATDTDQRSLSTTLGRLVESKWLRAEKPAGLDKRLTFYRLREPMLRHHLHYRAADDQPLPLIVELLRAWFDRDERRTHLIDTVVATEGERMLAFTYSGEPHRFDASYTSHDVDELLASARAWIHGGDAASRTLEAGELIEQCVLLAREGPAAAAEVAAHRGREVPASLLMRLPSITGDATPVQRIGDLLDAASEACEGRTHAVLELVAAGWNKDAVGVQRTRDRLTDLVTVGLMGVADDDVLLLDAEDELAYLIGAGGDPGRARQQTEKTLAQRIASQGADHPDVLNERQGLAFHIGEMGRPDVARKQLDALLGDYQRLMGPDHPDTLLTRHNLAHRIGQTGDRKAAREMYDELLHDYIRLSGPDHPSTLRVRLGLAMQSVGAGETAMAPADYGALLADCLRVLGPDDLDTIAARFGFARAAFAIGDYAIADENFSVAADGYERVLGSDHLATHIARLDAAFSAGAAGDPLEAHRRLRCLADRCAAHGQVERAIHAQVEAAQWAVAGDHADLAVLGLAELRVSMPGPNSQVDRALARAVVALLEQPRRTGADNVLKTDGSPLLADLRLAADGDAGARARLPGELVAVVDGVREGAGS